MRRQLARLVAAALLSSNRPLEIRAIAARTGSPEPLVSMALSELARQGLVAEKRDGYAPVDRVELALHAIGLGLDPVEAAKHLDWRMFERFVAEALDMAGFRVVRGLRLKPPMGLELDVLGLGPLYSPAVDCKHWSPGYSKKAKLAEAAEKHAERLRRLSDRWAETGLPDTVLVPVIVTLTDPGLRLVEGVAVVPVATLSDFLYNLPRYVEELGLRRFKASAKQ